MVLSGALNAAMRWGRSPVNPLEAVKRPRQQHPQPDPPTAEEAARIVSAAWEQDADWGTFVWLTFITGARRGDDWAAIEIRPWREPGRGHWLLARRSITDPDESNLTAMTEVVITRSITPSVRRG